MEWDRAGADRFSMGVMSDKEAVSLALDKC